MAAGSADGHEQHGRRDRQRTAGQTAAAIFDDLEGVEAADEGREKKGRRWTRQFRFFGM